LTQAREKRPCPNPYDPKVFARSNDAQLLLWTQSVRSVLHNRRVWIHFFELLCDRFAFNQSSQRSGSNWTLPDYTNIMTQKVGWFAPLSRNHWAFLLKLN
jgi:hypothetical protein